MSNDEMTPSGDSAFNELSDDELDEVAGGFNLAISIAKFSQTNFSFSQISQGGFNQTTLDTQNIESAAFQILVTDATSEDIKALGELFGGNPGIQGSP